MAVDIDPSDNSELIGKAGEKVMVVRQRQDSFNRVEITADGDVKVGTGPKIWIASAPARICI